MIPFGLSERFAEAPFWQIGAILLASMLLAFLGGQILRRKILRRGHKSAEDWKTVSGEEGYVLAAVLGLLALLTGFTFAMSIDLFETRRQLVLEEANAIGTVYLRAQLLEEPHRTRVSDLLVRYSEGRIELAEASRASEEQGRLRAQSDVMITELWGRTIAAYPEFRTTPFAAAFIGSVNDVIDLDQKRRTARSAHIPPTVFFVLLLYKISAAAALGYILVGSRVRRIAAFLLLLYAFALILIIDIDRPTMGGVVEAQAPMRETLDMMRAQPPGTYDRYLVTPTD